MNNPSVKLWDDDLSEAAVRCPVCACGVEPDDPEDPVVVCSRCSTPHHRDCWEYNGGCAVFGCKDQEPPDAVEIETWPLVLRQYNSWLKLTAHSRRASMVFAVSCLTAAHLALYTAYSSSAGVLVILMGLLPMLLSGLAFVLLEKKAAVLRRSVSSITGEAPFNERVSAREAGRWLVGAKSSVGGAGAYWYENPALAVLFIAMLSLLIMPGLPPGAKLYLAAFDAFVLFLSRDLFISMKKEQSILISRFKSSFSPLIEGKGRKGKV